MRIRRYIRELYDQPKVALSLKTRMAKAEAIEALLYGCSTWTLRQEHYSKLRTVQHRVLLRIIGAQRKRPDHWMTSSNRVLEISRCESIGTTLRARRFIWAGALIRMSGGRLPKRIMFKNLEGAMRRGRGGKEKEWTDCVQSDVQAFGLAGDWKATTLEAERGVCELRRLWTVGESLWSCGRKKRWTRLDTSRRRERQRDWGSCHRTPKRRTCEATPVGLLADEPKEPCTGERQPDTQVVPRHEYASRDVLLSIYSFYSFLCYTRTVFYFCFLIS